ncbi:MAG: LapA family protein [Gammaproteobacteria bacterium]|nr:LapA family protein [Gammaproteobacteria bacterium]
MKLIKTLFMLLVVAVGISFAILNAKSVPLNYYFDAKEISLALLIAITLAAGALIGLLLSIPSLFRLKRSNRQMKNRIKFFEKEIEHLRTLPSKPSE